jgi:hypothetical protein
MEFRDESGRTVFHIAALYNQKEAILMLLSIKANHEANDDFGYTPLLCAASRDNIEVFKVNTGCPIEIGARQVILSCLSKLAQCNNFLWR